MDGNENVDVGGHGVVASRRAVTARYQPGTCDWADRSSDEASDACFAASTDSAVSWSSARATVSEAKSSATTPSPRSRTTRAISGDGPITSASRACTYSKNLFGIAYALL